MRRTPVWVTGLSLWLVGAALPGVGIAQAAAASPDLDDPAVTVSDWHTANRGVNLSVSRITPAQARAFYRARGFDSGAAARYAAACVFQLVLRNDAAGATVSYRLADWRTASGRDAQPFVPTATWEREWARLGVSEPARIAFRWAQFPAEQEFAPGDWIMGMAALAPRPEGSFDLNYEWSIDGATHRGTLSGLRCADAD